MTKRKVGKIWSLEVFDPDPHFEEEIEFKVASIERMAGSLLDARDTFFDFGAFTKYMRDLWARRKADLSTARRAGTRKDSIAAARRAMEAADQLEAAYEYFEIAHRQRITGSYSDLLLSSRADSSFPGGMSEIIKAADYVCHATLRNLGRSWPGFVLFSLTGRMEVISSAIVVMKHSYCRRADFVQDWLVSAHEIGHIWYWDTRRAVDRSKPAPSRRELMITELLCDAFCHDHAFLGDSERFIEDFLFSRSYVLPIRFRSKPLLRYFVHRLLFVWMYTEIRKDGKIRGYLRDVLARFPPLAVVEPAEKKKHLSKFLADAVASSTISILPPERLKSDIVNFLVVDMNLDDAMADLLHGTLWATSRICEVSHFGGTGHRELVVPKRPPHNIGEIELAADAVCEGHIIEDLVPDPLALVKAVTDRCRSRGIDLDLPEHSHIRTAVILSLSNSFTLSQK